MTDSHTRRLASKLREMGEGHLGSHDDTVTCLRAAAAIDALLDAIEAGGMVQPRQAPQMDLAPLGTVLLWHIDEAYKNGDKPNVYRLHMDMVETLKKYFPRKASS